MCVCYKYLGLWLHEHLNLNKTVSELSKSASRAVSALYTKCLRAGGTTIDVFEKLYESLVEPVLFYGSEIWGISDHREIQTVQNKACRYFLGGGKCASNVALRGDMGWNSCYVKSKTEVFRMWIKLRNVSDDRILKTVHKWSKRNTRGWESRVLKLADNLNVTNIINDQNLPIRFALDSVKTNLCNRDAEKWTQALNKSDKLRTYKTYKCNLEREWYCTLPLFRDHRRVLFRLRSCSLPLEIETGRYTKPKTPLTDRLCKYCNSSAIEDETHFLLDCDLYTDIRSTLFEKALCLEENFHNLETDDKLRLIMQHKDLQFALGNAVYKMFRRCKLIMALLAYLIHNLVNNYSDF